MELRARVERLEQAQQPVQYEAPITEAEDAIRRLAALARSNDLNGQSVAVMTWRGVADWLTEQAQQQGNSSASLTSSAPEPADDETLHTVALGMVDTLTRLGVLPEILDTIRRAIREPMAPPAPSTPAWLVSDVGELIARFASTSRVGDDCTPCAEQVILAVADWCDGRGMDGAADWLRQEVGR
jgi:hypothetical protein